MLLVAKMNVAKMNAGDQPADLSPGLRMALIRSATAASTWMKHWPPIALHGPACCALGQRRGA